MPENSRKPRSSDGIEKKDCRNPGKDQPYGAAGKIKNKKDEKGACNEIGGIGFTEPEDHVLEIDEEMAEAEERGGNGKERVKGGCF
ncbi:hypothetical protein MASR2M17_14480 [Aminivibrio sp.]